MCGILTYPYIAYVEEVDTSQEIIDDLSDHIKQFIDIWNTFRMMCVIIKIWVIDLIWDALRYMESPVYF